jgi:hypothetical protein
VLLDWDVVCDSSADVGRRERARSEPLGTDCTLYFEPF